jgi:hypothetical protein
VSVCEFCESREVFVSAEVCVTPLTMKRTREPHFCLALSLGFVLRESRGVSDAAQAREGRANGSAQILSVYRARIASSALTDSQGGRVVRKSRTGVGGESRRFAVDGCLVMKGAELAVLLGSSARK